MHCRRRRYTPPGHQNLGWQRVPAVFRRAIEVLPRQLDGLAACPVSPLTSLWSEYLTFASEADEDEELAVPMDAVVDTVQQTLVLLGHSHATMHMSQRRRQN